MVTKERKIKSITQWARTFFAYLEYLQKASFLKHLPHILTYAREIMVMAEEGTCWQYYDELFRKETASMTEPYEWSLFREDLYHRANRQFRRAKNRYAQANATATSSYQQSSSFVPRGCTVTHTTIGVNSATTVLDSRLCPRDQTVGRNLPQSDPRVNTPVRSEVLDQLLEGYDVVVDWVGVLRSVSTLAAI